MADISVSHGYKLVLLTELAMNIVLSAGNDIYDKYIYIVDDEDYVTSDNFSNFVGLSKGAYFILFNRESMDNLNYPASEVYNFIEKGRYHYIESAVKFEESSIDNIDCVMVEV